MMCMRADLDSRATHAALPLRGGSAFSFNRVPVSYRASDSSSLPRKLVCNPKENLMRAITKAYTRTLSDQAIAGPGERPSLMADLAARHEKERKQPGALERRFRGHLKQMISAVNPKVSRRTR